MTGRKPAVCEVDRNWRRRRFWSVSEHSLNLCDWIDVGSVSASSDTSVRHRGHDVWFHSHLSTQQALHRPSVGQQTTAINSRTKSMDVLKEMLAGKRHDVVADAVADLADRALLVRLVRRAESDRQLVANLHRKSPEENKGQRVLVAIACQRRLKHSLFFVQRAVALELGAAAERAALQHRLPEVLFARHFALAGGAVMFVITAATTTMITRVRIVSKEEIPSIKNIPGEGVIQR